MRFGEPLRHRTEDGNTRATAVLLLGLLGLVVTAGTYIVDRGEAVREARECSPEEFAYTVEPGEPFHQSQDGEKTAYTNVGGYLEPRPPEGSFGTVKLPDGSIVVTIKRTVC